ncbi:hypothetical protein HDV00_012845, partial [Rhizophlyctis rosea]
QAHNSFVKPRKQTSIKPFLHQKTGFLAIDFIDLSSTPDKSYMYIFTCTDIYSRYLWAIPTKNQTSVVAARALKSVLDDKPNVQRTTKFAPAVLLETPQVEAGQNIKNRAAKRYASATRGGALNIGDTVRRVYLNKGKLYKPSKEGFYHPQKNIVFAKIASPYPNRLPSYKLQTEDGNLVPNLFPRWIMLRVSPGQLTPEQVQEGEDGQDGQA